MKWFVFACPADSIIVYNGLPLVFQYTSPIECNQVMWKNGKGTLITTGEETVSFEQDRYDELVVPFISLWTAEKERRAAVSAPTLDQIRKSALAAIDSRRYQAEISGITFQGMKIPTDRETQTILTNAATNALFDETATVRLKTGGIDASGTPVFVSLAGDVVKSLNSAVRKYVQNCYDVQAVKNQAMSKLQTAEEINKWLKDNLDLGWPKV